MDAQARLTYLTRHYYDLQTVRFAPVWWFLLAGLALKRLFARCQCPPVPAVGAFLLGFLAVQVAWYLLANRYYRRKFGWLEPSSAIALPLKPNRIYLVILLAILIWAMLDSFSSARHREWFPSMLAFLLAGPAFVPNAPALRRWTYGISGAVIGASLLATDLLHLSGDAIVAIIGTTMLLVGISDHILLVRLFPLSRGDADA